MGNYRFRLSEMIPNAWFHKLKDLSSSSSSRSSRNQIPNTKEKHSQFPTTTTVTKQQRHSKSDVHATAKTAEAKAEKTEFYDLSHSRKSYYFTREFVNQTDPKIQHIFSFSNNTNLPDPPRKSAKRRTTKHRKSTTTTKHSTSSGVSGGCRCRVTPTATLDSFRPKPNSYPSPLADVLPDNLSLRTQFCPDHAALSCSADSRCRAHQIMAAENDIIIAVDKKSLVPKEEEINGFDSISKHDLAPIMTKPVKFNDMIREIRNKEVKKNRANGSDLKEQRSSSNSIRRSFSVNSPTTRVRLRLNSPRTGRKGQGNSSGRRSSISGTGSSQRRSISSESFAIVKSSFDPQKDFRESMVEMIVQNNIRGSEDLEELLACYLSLNSDEYHDLIIKVFKQIWFDMAEIRRREE
ncbi:hypothetical protein Ancab_014183 [Ancistrocladus abbreviatus]